MNLHTLAAVLISWVVPTAASREEKQDWKDLPLWERHPAEQRAVREQARRDAQSWNHIPRSW